MNPGRDPPGAILDPSRDLPGAESGKEWQRSGQGWPMADSGEWNLVYSGHQILKKGKGGPLYITIFEIFQRGHPYKSKKNGDI